ncbi:hypothetical protein KDM41_17590, partial [bacterium]|nr:hypothetical protein [bacterium]
MRHIATRSLPLVFFFAAIGSVLAAAPVGAAFVSDEVLLVDGVGAPGLSPAADLLSVQLGHDTADGRPVLRCSFLSLSADVPGGLARAFVASGRPRSVGLAVSGAPAGQPQRALAAVDLVSRGARFELDDPAKNGRVWTDPADPDAIFIGLDEDPAATGSWRFTVATTQ